MNAKRRWLSLLMCLSMLFALAACGNTDNAGDAQEQEEPQVQPEETETAEDDSFLFTDSTGREVELPRNITRVVSAGPIANVLLYAVNADVLVGWATIPSETAMSYLGEEYWELPEYGKLYGNSEFNLEAIMASDPQVIIDVGEWDEAYKEDLDALQEQIGIPVILLNGNLDEYPAAFRTLGELLGEPERGEVLAAYCEEVMTDAVSKVAEIPLEERPTLYYGDKNEGLSAMISGTTHAQVIELLGATMVVRSDDALVASGGGNVSLEQLMSWDPDVIIFGQGSVYDSVADDASWNALSAIRNGTYYEVPVAPFNFLAYPPSANRIIGIRWLGNLLYPEVFDYDMKEELKEFFSLFYRYDLTDEEATEILANSTLKNTVGVE